jgi:hypothetical protein
MQTPTFSLDKFEAACYRRQHEEAARLLLVLLDTLDKNYGSLGPNFNVHISALISDLELSEHIIGRLTSAISCLFSDENFHLSIQGFSQLIGYQRWLSTLFAASSFKNTDHILKVLNLNESLDQMFRIDERTIAKLCLLYSPESEISMNMDALWDLNPKLAVSLACALISPRFLGTPAAHGKREVLLQWLPPKLEKVDDLDFLPVPILHDVYMNCSYADLRQRHDVKAPINKLIRKKLLSLGFQDIPHAEGKNAKPKPVMLVLLEWFSNQHSIYRTHSLTLNASRKNFHVIGIGGKAQVDEAGQKIFDEFIEINTSDILGSLKVISQAAQKNNPSIFYMPSVGMFPLSLFATNLRFAPLQAYALGHPATTHSEFIDYAVVEEDYVGDPKCFSEKLLKLPANGMPYRPSASLTKIIPIYRKEPEIVEIAVASSLMKINPRFLQACKLISEGTQRKVHFQFLLGFAHGLVYQQAKSLITAFLPNSTIHAHQPYTEYLSVINRCDMYINPFPFGNTNGLVDMTHQNLVGVCMNGPEVFESIDQALMNRLELPSDLIANSLEEYVQASIKLIEDDKRRMMLRKQLATKKSIQNLFNGNEHVLGEQFLRLVANKT